MSQVKKHEVPQVEEYQKVHVLIKKGDTINFLLNRQAVTSRFVSFLIPKAESLHFEGKVLDINIDKKKFTLEKPYYIIEVDGEGIPNKSSVRKSVNNTFLQRRATNIFVITEENTVRHFLAKGTEGTEGRFE
jgi:hypothetical protein